jgi:hypothetical protein
VTRLLQPNRRARKLLFRATAVLSLAVWLFMAAAENYKPLHAWLHGGAVPDHDDCAIVAVSHGKIETSPVTVPVALAVTWIETTPRVEYSVFSASVEHLPNGRGPPSLPAVS